VRRGGISWGPPIFVVLSIAVLVLLFGNPFGKSSGNGGTSAQAVPVAETSQKAERATVSNGADQSAGQFTAGGYLEVIPPGPQIVSALIGGRVASIDVVPGQQIAAGDTVATLDDTHLGPEWSLQEAKRDIARRQLELIEAGFRPEEIEEVIADRASHQAELALALAELERAEGLFGQGLISAQELEEEQSQYKQAVANLEAADARVLLYQAGSRAEEIALARAELKAANAALEFVAWELEQCVILAPVSGVVAEQYVQPGAWVEPGTDNRHSSALISILDPKRIQAWVDVNQRDSAGLYIGQSVLLTTDAFPDRQVAAEVIRIMPVANLQKNTVQVKLAIDDPPVDFRPELSVKIEFLPAQR